jgi:signal transduction histidine kinase
MSIRTRLTWAYGIGVAATLMVVGLLVWWQMSDTLVRGLGTAIQTQSGATLTSIENQGQAGLQDSDQAVPGIWTVLFDAQLRRFDASAGAPSDVPVVPGTFVAGGHRYLLRVDTAEDGTIVVTGADLAPVAESQAALARILLGVGLSVGAASLVAGWMLAGRGLRPIDRLIADAEALGPGDLDQRLAQPAQMDEVGRLTLTLNGMLDRIAESVTRQRLFVAMASHELRTPLAALRAELDLADRDGSASVEDYRSAIREAQADVVRLTTLTASMLELATAADETLPLVRTRVSVKALAASAMRAVAPLAQRNSVVVVVDVPDEIVWVDRTRVEQALVNLISNAIVHSTMAPHIELIGQVSGGEARLLTLSVLDRGPGFAGNEPTEMFTAFRRGIGGRAKGSGLGLAMVAATARAHGGSHGAADREGGGAIVWLTVPAAPDVAARREAVPPRAGLARPGLESAESRRGR